VEEPKVLASWKKCDIHLLNFVVYQLPWL
jgi:hypothetical protein